MAENYYCNMRNLDINKIGERLFVISEYGVRERYYNPSYGEDKTLTEQDEEATPADTELAGELDALTAGAIPAEETTAPDMAATPMDDMTATGSTEQDEVEIDVTDIVKGVEKAEDTVEALDDKVEGLGSQVNDYIEKLLQSNEMLMNKVSELEKNMNQQFVQRTPTPYEQLMLRSMSSYPYTQKLTDYWTANALQKDLYTTNKDSKSEEESEEDETPKVYNLTYKDINDSFSDVDIKKTF